MSLEEAILSKEEALIYDLQSKKQGISDRTGKGSAAEKIIEKELIKPFLAPRFDCTKGTVVQTTNPENQSPAIDRVIYDRAAASPLIYDSEHSVLPIECVCGLVEITISLDASKLREDIQRMVDIKMMTVRRVLEPIPGTSTQAYSREESGPSPRSFVIGLPVEPKMDPRTIAKTLRQIQLDLGDPTFVHGLYVIGIGFFETIPAEPPDKPRFDIRIWEGPDRLFRFSSKFRQSFDRWPSLPPGWAMDLSDYIKGEFEVISG